MPSDRILFRGKGSYSIGHGHSSCEIILSSDQLIIGGGGNFMRINLRDITGFSEVAPFMTIAQVEITGPGFWLGLQVDGKSSGSAMGRDAKEARREFMSKLQEAMMGA